MWICVNIRGFATGIQFYVHLENKNIGFSVVILGGYFQIPAYIFTIYYNTLQKIIQLICVIIFNIYNHWWISLGDQMRIIDLTCKPQSVSRQRYQNTNHNTKVESLYTKITLQVVNFMINCEATFMK